MTTKAMLMSVFAVLGLAFLGGCNDSAEPEHIQVQHILIAFKGSIPKPTVTRTQADAEKLAGELLAQAQKGGSFDDLVSKNTDDQAPGVYGMSNKGIAPVVNPSKPSEREYPREGMVPAFGDVGFKLKVGEIGLAKFDPKTSPFGYHIIKRIK